MSLKQRLAAKEFVIATNIGGANPDAVEMLSGAGGDMAFIDCERSGIGLDMAGHLIRAARAAAIPAVVRSWSKDPAVLVQYLDQHADGIVVPHINSRKEAEDVVEVVRYGCGGAAEKKIVGAQIETRAAISAAEELAKVPGIDFYFIGPNDLAYEMTGTRGAKTAEVREAVQYAAEKLRIAGKPFGMPCPIDDIAPFKALGATVLYYPLEWLIKGGLEQLRQAIARSAAIATPLP
jgi:2-keto-3-deoxy-L-rhamnonate aldolase RhmA